MSQLLLNLTIGFAISAILAFVSVRGRSLTFGGGLGAVVIGTAIYGYAGWTGYVVLLSFFFSSTVLTKVRYSTKAAKGVSELKAGARSIWQTTGQGGVAAILTGIALFFPREPALVAAGFVGALAEANADTWAVEVGVLSKRYPRLITKFSKEVLPGTSGGISSLGEFSAVAGSVFVALVAGVLGVFGSAPLLLFAATVIAAVVGEHVDSVLGATVQAVYHCPRCEKETERKVHRCGTHTKHLRGFEAMTNEAVNFVSTAIAAAIAVGLTLVFYLVL